MPVGISDFRLDYGWVRHVMLFPFDKKLYSTLFPSDPSEILGVFTLQWTSVPSRQE